MSSPSFTTATASPGTAHCFMTASTYPSSGGAEEAATAKAGPEARINPKLNACEIFCMNPAAGRASALPAGRTLNNSDVLELPGIRGIQVLGEQLAPLIKRGPIGVPAHHRAEVGSTDLKRPLVVHIVRLHDTALRVLHGPYHSGQGGRGDLQAGGAVVRREPARLGDGQLRTIPIGILRVPGEQHTEFIDSLRDLAHHDAFAILQMPIAAGELMYGQHRAVAWMVGVMSRRPVRERVAVHHRVKVRQRYRFRMGD